MHAFAERGNDLYETPACCVTAAISAGIFPGADAHVWEPCAGRGAIARELFAAGYRVTAQDLVAYDGADEGIETPIDFLTVRRAPDGASVIITNPPYRLSDAFVRHGLGLGLRVIVLLRAMAVEGAGRADLIDRHLRDYWIGMDRPPAMHREGWAGNRLATSAAPFAWFDFNPEPRPAGQPVALHRFRWKAA
jgi:hypothetical protein